MGGGGEGNMAQRKVKNSEKSPWGQCLTRPVPNGRRRSAFWLGRKTQKFSGTNQKPELRWPFGTGVVRHCPQGLFSPSFTFLHAIFPTRLDFPSPPLSAPGSPRMLIHKMKPLLFLHPLWQWKDSDNQLGEGGGGVNIMYLCKIWVGVYMYATVLPETLILLQIFDFCLFTV